MPVKIIPVRCSEGRRFPVDFELPALDTAEAVATKALERHPFLAVDGCELSRDPSAATVRVEVAVRDGPHSREYSLGRLGAEIRYDPFLADGENEVELLLHLRCYMGVPVEPKPEGELPPAVEIASRPFDEAGLRRTLWHEYGHLLDALRPEFRYDLTVKGSLSTYGRAVVNELWNAFIDRRLKAAAREADKPFIKLFRGPTEAHTRPALEMMLRGIWADGREWTYRELVRAALDLPPR